MSEPFPAVFGESPRENLVRYARSAIGARDFADWLAALPDDDARVVMLNEVLPPFGGGREYPCAGTRRLLSEFGPDTKPDVVLRTIIALEVEAG